MMELSPLLLGELTIEIESLVENHPAVLEHPNKKFLYEWITSQSPFLKGQMRVSRWQSPKSPELWSNLGATSWNHQPVKTHVQDTAYEYGQNETKPSGMHWHINFADPHLFCAYGAAAFVQDEIQVAEHPVLGSLLEFLKMRNDPALLPLVLQNNQPTPILIENVPRQAAVDTEPDLEKGIVYGVYGGRFSRAKHEEIQRAVTILRSPTISHLVAMAAIDSGQGLYTEQQLSFLLTTALTAFRAAKLSSERAEKNCVIHTGFWGCGAFGGDRVLMAWLQLCAAKLAGVDSLVFYAFDENGKKEWEKAQRFQQALEAKFPQTFSHKELMDSFLERRFQWGRSDGN
jgi:hypothetical protein